MTRSAVVILINLMRTDVRPGFFLNQRRMAADLPKSKQQYEHLMVISVQTRQSSCRLIDLRALLQNGACPAESVEDFLRA